MGRRRAQLEVSNAPPSPPPRHKAAVVHSPPPSGSPKRTSPRTQKLQEDAATRAAITQRDYESSPSLDNSQERDESPEEAAAPKAEGDAADDHTSRKLDSSSRVSPATSASVDVIGTHPAPSKRISLSPATTDFSAGQPRDNRSQQRHEHDNDAEMVPAESAAGHTEAASPEAAGSKSPPTPPSREVRSRRKEAAKKNKQSDKKEEEAEEAVDAFGFPDESSPPAAAPKGKGKKGKGKASTVAATKKRGGAKGKKKAAVPVAEDEPDAEMEAAQEAEAKADTEESKEQPAAAAAAPVLEEAVAAPESSQPAPHSMEIDGQEEKKGEAEAEQAMEEEAPPSPPRTKEVRSKRKQAVAKVPTPPPPAAELEHAEGSPHGSILTVDDAALAPQPRHSPRFKPSAAAAVASAAPGGVQMSPTAVPASPDADDEASEPGPTKTSKPAGAAASKRKQKPSAAVAAAAASELEAEVPAPVAPAAAKHKTVKPGQAKPRASLPRPAPIKTGKFPVRASEPELPLLSIDEEPVDAVHTADEHAIDFDDGESIQPLTPIPPRARPAADDSEQYQEDEPKLVSSWKPYKVPRSSFMLGDDEDDAMEAVPIRAKTAAKSKAKPKAASKAKPAPKPSRKRPFEEEEEDSEGYSTEDHSAAFGGGGLAGMTPDDKALFAEIHKMRADKAKKFKVFRDEMLRSFHEYMEECAAAAESGDQKRIKMAMAGHAKAFRDECLSVFGQAQKAFGTLENLLEDMTKGQLQARKYKGLGKEMESAVERAVATSQATLQTMIKKLTANYEGAVGHANKKART